MKQELCNYICHANREPSGRSGRDIGARETGTAAVAMMLEPGDEELGTAAVVMAKRQERPYMTVAYHGRLQQLVHLGVFGAAGTANLSRQGPEV